MVLNVDRSGESLAQWSGAGERMRSDPTTTSILQRIEGLLQTRLRADDASGIGRRRQQLRDAFGSLPASSVISVHRRLSTERRDDRLSRLFYGRISQATRDEMLGILRERMGLAGRVAAPSTPGRRQAHLRVISNLRVKPPIIRVHEHESVRVDFVAPDGVRSIAAFVLSEEEREGSAYRFFELSTSSGYHSLIWDGTFIDFRNRPPVEGTYRIRLMVDSRDGRKDDVAIPIQVLNPYRRTVLPRNNSGLTLQSLRFDGANAVLSDSGGNAIRARAISGLTPKHPKNIERLDYTRPRYQWVRDRGPLPAGRYVIRKHSVQQPASTRDRGLVYPTGGLERAWGPYRVPLYPLKVGNRSGFFFHLDVHNDGTSGCIGVQTSDEGKFNQMISLIALMPNEELPILVNYR